MSTEWHNMATAPLPVNNIRRSTCRTCGNTFATTGAFDSHRVGTHGQDRRCLYPGIIGLRIRQVPKGAEWAMVNTNGYWSTRNA